MTSNHHQNNRSNLSMPGSETTFCTWAKKQKSPPGTCEWWKIVDRGAANKNSPMMMVGKFLQNNHWLLVTCSNFCVFGGTPRVAHPPQKKVGRKTFGNLWSGFARLLATIPGVFEEWEAPGQSGRVGGTRKTHKEISLLKSLYKM